jgi:hypothetical protein
MGDRVVFQIDSGAGNSICLYSHWGGSTALDTVQRALAKAMPRIDMADYEYATRIIVSSIVGGDWDSELGYGLYAGPDNSGEELYVIDLVRRNVTLPDGTLIDMGKEVMA